MKTLKAIGKFLYTYNLGDFDEYVILRYLNLPIHLDKHFVDYINIGIDNNHIVRQLPYV